MTDSTLRQKYGLIMDWRVQVIITVFDMTCNLAVPAYRTLFGDLNSSELPYCKSAFTPWQLWAGSILTIILLWCFIIKKLRGRDTLSMNTEILRTVAAFILCYSPLITVVALMESGLLQHDSRIQLLVVPCSLFMIFDINVLSRHAWGELPPLKKTLWSTRSSAAVHSGADDDCIDAVQDPTELNTSLAILHSPALCAAYAAFVEKSLCYESFKFLVDATAYAKETYDSTSAQVSSVSLTIIVLCMCKYLS
jgi:hypothetical protein